MSDRVRAAPNWSPWLFTAGAVVLVALYALTVAPSFGRWHDDDDYRNLRWALEYRAAPWCALTQLHSLHDHIRPAALISVWFGAVLGNGRWGGIHAVLIALHAAAVGGAGVLAWRLSGQRWFGLVAAALTLSFLGTVLMSEWNSWIGSAGELAFGLWGLVALHRALRRDTWPLLAILLLLVAGLYKEPGWLVYPVAAAAMVWAAWHQGQRGPRRLAALISVPIGIAGLIITWHPTNVFRIEAPTSALDHRVIHGLDTALQRWVDTGGPPDVLDAGMPNGLGALLLALAFVAALWIPRRSPWLALAWTVAVAGVTVAAIGQPSAVGWGLAAAVAVALVRHWRSPAPGLILALAGPAVMAPFDMGSPVQVLSGAYGLCIFVAVALARLWTAGSPRALIRGLIVLALALQLLQTGHLVVTQRPSRQAEALRRDRDHFLGFGALSFALRQDRAVCAQDQHGLEIAPLLPLTILDRAEPRHPRFLVNGRLYFRGERSVVRAVLFERNLLSGLELPLLRSIDTQRLRPGETVTSLHGAAIVHRGDGLLLEDLAPGFYALGYRLATDGEGERVQLEALDGCGTLWKVDSSAGPAEFYIETVRVHRRCPSLELSQSGNGRRDVEQFFLASLPTPHVSLWAADDVPRWLDVSVSETGVVPGMYDTQ